jgi:predicted DsbA family dithiol-disulfide isomerase
LFSDFICPYCYVGERLAAPVLEEFGLALDWRGYEIHPEIPPEGLATNQTDRSGLERLWSRVETFAASLEVPIRRPSMIPSSRLALEGAELARREGKLEPYRERIFSAFFREGLDIGDPDRLTELAVDAGLDRALFQEAIRARHFRDTIDEHREQAEDHLVTGVPTFFLFGVPVVGAQSSEAYRRSFARILERRAAKQTAS